MKSSNTVRFTRLRVEDLATFMRIHEQAMAAQTEFGLEENVYQSVDDPSSLTVVIRGDADAIESWLTSGTRAALAKELKLIDKPVSWNATELDE